MGNKPSYPSVDLSSRVTGYGGNTLHGIGYQGLLKSQWRRRTLMIILLLTIIIVQTGIPYSIECLPTNLPGNLILLEIYLIFA